MSEKDVTSMREQAFKMKQYDACKTLTSDYIATFWRLLEEGNVRIVVDTHHPEWFGDLGEWASSMFSDNIAKALVAERRELLNQQIKPKVE